MDDEQQPSEGANWQYNPENLTTGNDGADLAESRGVPLPAIPSVEWTASEYVAHEKSIAWYFMLFAGGGVAVFIVFLITRDILASIVVLLACTAVSVYAGRKPSTNRYVVDERGIQVEDRLYPYRVFMSFSVVEEGAINCVWLKPLKRFSPVVVMYFSPEDEQRIVDVLANFLPHEERELDTIDRLTKRMRF